MLWNAFCVVPLCLVYRGRTIPLAWKVLRHPSASVAFRDYRGVLGFVARLLRGYEGVLLADRGFLHGELLRWVGRTAGWHLRVRCKRNVGLFRRTGRGYGRLALRLSPGEVRYDHGVYVTGARIPVHLAVGWEKGAKEPWIIVSDEPTDAETLYEYGRRFTIEEGFLDDQSHGFQWESSKLRKAEVLQRLCFVMAVATWVLVCQGVEVVAAGKRRQVDPHWFRGHSYAHIGWNWIRRAAARGEALIGRLALLTAHDPEPARASRRQVDRSRWMDDLPQRYIFLIPAPSTSEEFCQSIRLDSNQGSHHVSWKPGRLVIVPQPGAICSDRKAGVELILAYCCSLRFSRPCQTWRMTTVLSSTRYRGT